LLCWLACRLWGLLWTTQAAVSSLCCIAISLTARVGQKGWGAIQALGPSLNNASNSFFLVLHCNLLNDEKPVLNAACIVVLFYVYKYMYTFLKLLGSFSIYQRFLVLHTVNRLHTVVGSVTWLNVGTHVVGRQ
jgi:hypothetical protein